MTLWLVLFLDAPLMSFGGPMIDQHGVTRDMPGRAMLTGLLGNALGYDHREAGKLERLQSRLVHATLSLRSGDRLTDFHTVDLGQSFLREGWTTRGVPQGREGGTAATGTHIRRRHYLAGAQRLVVLTLDPAAEAPTVEDIGNAVARPARPLFLGRKTCLPARPLLAGRIEADDPVSALMQGYTLIFPQLSGAPDDGAGLRAEWPLPLGTRRAPPGCQIETIIDRRDWTNQLHGGERLVVTGPLPAPNSGGCSV